MIWKKKPVETIDVVQDSNPPVPLPPKFDEAKLKDAQKHKPTTEELLMLVLSNQDTIQEGQALIYDFLQTMTNTPTTLTEEEEAIPESERDLYLSLKEKNPDAAKLFLFGFQKPKDKKTGGKDK
jgi:hypothetical protein